jgi:tetratricopeptide (TPR) repeat protein
MSPNSPGPQNRSFSRLVPQRWDRRLAVATADEKAGSRPGKLVTVLIGTLCIAATAGVIYLWKQGLLEPEKAAALTGRPIPSSESITVSLESARKYMNEGEWGKAEAILRQAAMEFPEDQEVRIALAEDLVAQKRFPDAYDQYEKALAIGPREGRLEFAAGLVANTAGKPDRALEHFFAAQSSEPSNANYALNLGLVQRKLNDLDGAKANLLRAANLDPSNAFAWGVMADIALGENNVGMALQHIARARSLQPESKDWRLIEARALKRKGDPERALMVLIPMDTSQKREPQVVRLIAECYGMLQRHGDAATALADASKSNPTSGELAYDAAVGFERAGNRTQAIEFARRGKMLGHEGAAKLLERIQGQ